MIAVIVAIALPLTYFLNARNRFVCGARNRGGDQRAHRGRKWCAPIRAMWRFQTAKAPRSLSNAGRAKARWKSVEWLTWMVRLIVEQRRRRGSPDRMAFGRHHGRGVKVGEMEVGRSITPLYWMTFKVGLISFLIALAVFIIVRVLPLRALNQAMAENHRLLEESREAQKTLTIQASELTTAKEVAEAATGAKSDFWPT